MAEPAHSRADQRAGLGWSLWSVAFALPWLLPTHSDPWTTFYSEVFMVAAMLPMALWALAASKAPWRIDVMSATFGAAALVPLLQALGGMFSMPAEAPLVSLYLSAFMLTLLVARHADDIARERLADAMFAGLLIASLTSTGIALYQWLGLDTLGVLLAPKAPGDRPVANVGQSNNLSTLLVWGLIAVWWAHARKSIGGLGASLAAGFLLMGVVLTQSRTGMLAVGLLAGVAFSCRGLMGSSRCGAVWASLAIWFVALNAALGPMSQVLSLDIPRAVLDQEAPRARLAILEFALSAIAHQPGLGYGWNQTVTAHVALANHFPLQQNVGHAHNIVLDLMLWNGIPIAVLLLAGFGFWTWHMMRNVRTQEQVLLLLGLSVLVLHSMLELPHVLAVFLFPAALMMGTLHAIRPTRTMLSVPRAVIFLGVLMHAAVLVAMFADYRAIEEHARSERFRAARIGGLAQQPAPSVLVLRSLQDALATLGTEPRRGMAPGELSQLRRTVVRYPNQGALFRYALASALNGRADEAAWALNVLCSLNSRKMCEAAVKGWAELEADGRPEMAQVELPLLRK